VVLARVDAVDADSVDTELLKEGYIALAACHIGEGVLEVGGLDETRARVDSACRYSIRIESDVQDGGRTLGLVSDALNIEAAAVRVVKEATGAGDRTQGLNLGRKGCHNGQGGREASGRKHEEGVRRD
jgi:hypothetical protein